MQEMGPIFWKVAGVYLLGVNLVALVLFALDKLKARSGRWRIPERTLLLSAWLGGSLGAYLGMVLFHHKTLKRKFSITVPLLLLVHILLAIGIFLHLRGIV